MRLFCVKFDNITDKFDYCVLGKFVLLLYQQQSPPTRGERETAMTQETQDNRSRAELMDMLRDAARSGDLTTADLYELADYASRLKRERVGTPEAASA
jgi:hypothetical protein